MPPPPVANEFGYGGQKRPLEDAGGCSSQLFSPFLSDCGLCWYFRPGAPSLTASHSPCLSSAPFPFRCFFTRMIGFINFVSFLMLLTWRFLTKNAAGAPPCCVRHVPAGFPFRSGRGEPCSMCLCANAVLNPPVQRPVSREDRPARRSA